MKNQKKNLELFKKIAGKTVVESRGSSQDLNVMYGYFPAMTFNSGVNSQ